MTKWYLVSMLFLSSQGDQFRTIRLPNGLYIDVQLLAIEREDGSGSSFNLKVRRKDGSVETVHVRTLD